MKCPYCGKDHLLTQRCPDDDPIFPRGITPPRFERCKTCGGTGWILIRGPVYTMDRAMVCPDCGQGSRRRW